ncbi:MAG: preprotein translocase subunit SecE [Gemmataceae bacterium]
MATVAEKSTQEKTKKSTKKQKVSPVGILSLLEGIYILIAFGIVFSGIPVWWCSPYGPEVLLGLDKGQGAYLSTSLLLIVCGVAGVVLGYLCQRIEGVDPLKGQRAGAVVSAFVLFLSAIFGLWIVGSLAQRDAGLSVAYGFGGGVVALTLFGLYTLYSRPDFGNRLVKWEENGWFHATGFKSSQGTRVRRTTLIAMLLIIGCGIFAAIQANLFGSGHWAVSLPNSGLSFPTLKNEFGKPLVDAWPVLLSVEYTAPLVCFAFLGWFAWRLTNWPTFADFLIATEAEMNKVSWSTRKRLFQDTIVVLVTVLLMTLFLFLVDILWIQLLKSPVPGVLRIDPLDKKKEIQKKEW